jgi:hypothetical protein
MPPIDSDALEAAINDTTPVAEPTGDPKAARGDFVEAPPKKEPSAAAEALQDASVELADEAAKAEGDDKKDEVKEPARDEDGKFAPKKEKILIPKSRFDELNTKRKAEIEAAERRIAELETQLGVREGEQDISELEKTLKGKNREYARLLADGELDKADNVMDEINTINRRIVMLEVVPLTTKAAAQTHQANTLERLVEHYKSEFPIFDETSGEFNQEMVTWVAHRQGKFERSGDSPAEALRQAVEDAVAHFDLLDRTPPEPTKSKKEVTEGDRKTKAVTRAVDAANKQPARIDKQGQDSDKQGLSNIDVDSLSLSDLGKLPESTLKRLRGDFFS